MFGDCPIKHKTPKHKKSKNWIARQNRDQFVKQARSQGLRARSVFKLQQIDQKYRLIKPYSKIVDLGAAPGSWSQYAASKVIGSDQCNQIVAVDLLPMKEIAKVWFVQGDFTDVEIHRQVCGYFKTGKIDLVLSDMAPNITGIGITDQANAAQLQDTILTFCLTALNLHGHLLTKLFEGESVGCVRKKMTKYFEQIQMIKPEASRAESKEVYLLARGFRTVGRAYE